MTTSNTAATLSTISAVMKEIFEPEMQMLIDQKHKAVKIFGKKTQKFSDTFYITTDGSWNRGLGAAGENVVLPPTGKYTPDRMELGTRYLWEGVQLTMQSILQSRGSEQSAEDAVTGQIKNIKNGFVKELNRVFWGLDGRLGITAEAYNGGAPTVITLAAPDYARYFMIGDVIVFSDKDSPFTVRGGTSTEATVTAVDKTANTITVTSSIPTQVENTDIIYRALTGAGVTSRGNYPQGLRQIVDDGTYASTTFQGKTRSASTPTLLGNVLDNSGVSRALTNNLLDRAFDKTAENSNEEAPDLLIGDTSVLRAYRDLFVPDIRYVSGGALDPRGDVQYNGMTLQWDTDAPYNSLFMIKKSTIKWLESSPFTWASAVGTDGASGDNIWMWLGTGTTPYANYEARCFQAGNLGCYVPAANTIITDITAA